MQLSVVILDQIVSNSFIFWDLEEAISNSWNSFDLAGILNNDTLIGIYGIVDANTGTNYVEQATNGGSPINITTIENYAEVAVNLIIVSLQCGAG